MKGVCLIDTSILCELLEVPGKSGGLDDVQEQFVNRANDFELVLPFTTVLETGNHIGQCSKNRFSVATRFTKLVGAALDGTAPFTASPFPDEAVWRELLDRFPTWASGGAGLGDLTIVQVLEQYQARFPTRSVCIWSLDRDLSAYGSK
jgi:hypothetical protein